MYCPILFSAWQQCFSGVTVLFRSGTRKPPETRGADVEYGELTFGIVYANYDAQDSALATEFALARVQQALAKALKEPYPFLLPDRLF